MGSVAEPLRREDVRSRRVGQNPAGGRAETRGSCPHGLWRRGASLGAGRRLLGPISRHKPPQSHLSCLQKPDDWSAGIERAIRRQAAAATAAPEAAASEATAPASASAGAGAAQHPPTSSPAPVTLSKSAPVAPTSAPVAASAALEDVTALAIPVRSRERLFITLPRLPDASSVPQSCDLRCLGLPPSGAGRLVSLDLADNRLTAKEVDSLPRTAPWLRVLDITGEPLPLFPSLPLPFLIRLRHAAGLQRTTCPRR